MTQAGCRLRNFFIASVLALTLSNVLLTVRLLHSSDCPQSPSSAQLQKPVRVPEPTTVPPCIEYPPAAAQMPEQSPNRTGDAPFAHLDLRLGRWDSRRLYKYFDFALTGDKFAELSSKFTVCLATQSSLEKLYSLVQVSRHWSGSISAAVFAAGDDELGLLQLYVAYLRMCFISVRERVSFHLAFPKDRCPVQIPKVHKMDLARYDCTQPEATLSELLKLRKGDTSKWRIKNAYPQNHLRNLARKACQSGYVFLTDVDIVPSARLAESLDEFLRGARCKGLCAYVIPTYELDDRVRFPKSKADLVRLAGKGLARPFHHKVFIYNQYATNFSRWQAAVPESDKTHISHNVTNFEFLYEPFYVAPDTTPPHDERFLGYGYTRNTQVYEMFVAGYEFHVLSPIFTCHWGLQNKKSRPAWRERQNIMNRHVFDVFKREVFARYHKDPLKMLQPRKASKT